MRYFTEKLFKKLGYLETAAKAITDTAATAMDTVDDAKAFIDDISSLTNVFRAFVSTTLRNPALCVGPARHVEWVCRGTCLV